MMKGISPLLLGIVLLSCSIVHGQQTITLRVDPDNARGGVASEIFDSLVYIPLETKRESIFGNIDRLELSDDYFIILDHNTNAIYLFKKDGTFHTKITLDKWLKTMNKELSGIRDFTVNNEKKEVIVSHILDQKAYYIFDFEGKFKRKVALNALNNLACIDKEHYFYETIENHEDFSKPLLLTKGSCILYNGALDTELGYVLPSVSYDYMKAGGFRLTKSFNTSVLFYTRPFNYDVYRVDSNGVNSTFRFIFPMSYSLPSHFSDSTFNGKRRGYLDQQLNTIYSLSDLYQVGKHLIFSAHNSSFSTNSPYLYNLESGSLFFLDHISPDSTNSFLPLSDNIILAADTVSVYTSVAGYEMFESREKEKARKPVYTQTLQKFFKTQNRNSNPVIVKLIVKAGI
jgi:hypothetical protein